MDIIWKYHDYGPDYFVQPTALMPGEHELLGKSFYTCNYVCPDCGKNIFKSNVKGEFKGNVSLPSDQGDILFSSVFYCPDCGKIYTVGKNNGLAGTRMMADGRSYTANSLADGKVFEVTDPKQANMIAVEIDEKIGAEVIG